MGEHPLRHPIENALAKVRAQQHDSTNGQACQHSVERQQRLPADTPNLVTCMTTEVHEATREEIGQLMFAEYLAGRSSGAAPGQTIQKAPYPWERQRGSF